MIPLWKELEYYKDYQRKLRSHLGPSSANQVLANALYMISMGTNDFLENYYTMPGRRSQFSVRQYEDFLVGIAEKFVRELYGLGARKISLGGLPPMGCLPLERTTNVMNQHECVDSYNNQALEFNAKLKVMVARLSSELPGINLVFSNPYYILMHIVRRPAFYGEPSLISSILRIYTDEFVLVNISGSLLLAIISISHIQEKYSLHKSRD